MNFHAKAAAFGVGLWAASLGSQAMALDGQQVVKSLRVGEVAAIARETGLDLKPSGNGLFGEYKGVPVGITLEVPRDRCSAMAVQAAYGKQDLSPKFLLAFNKHYVPRLIAHEDGKVFLWMPIQFAEGVTVNYLKYMILLTMDASEKATTYEVKD